MDAGPAQEQQPPQKSTGTFFPRNHSQNQEASGQQQQPAHHKQQPETTSVHPQRLPNHNPSKLKRSSSLGIGGWEQRSQMWKPRDLVVKGKGLMRVYYSVVDGLGTGLHEPSEEEQ